MQPDRKDRSQTEASSLAKSPDAARPEGPQPD
jgi:hypothetical protein